MSILLIEQNVKFALSVADRYAVLKLGEIVDRGDVGDAELERRITDQLSVDLEPPMTFSIVAHCPRTGMLGVAVATAVPAVGSMCPYVKTGVGAVSTQSWVNPYLAIDALRLMEQGKSAPEALEAVIAGGCGRETCARSA